MGPPRDVAQWRYLYLPKLHAQDQDFREALLRDQLREARVLIRVRNLGLLGSVSVVHDETEVPNSPRTDKADAESLWYNRF
jgi:hypothetical protein